MASKYEKVIGGLTPAPPADAEQQARVDAEKASFDGLSATQLAARYALLRLEHDVKKAEAALIYVKVEAVAQLLWRSQENKDEGWGQYGVEDNALRLPDGSTVRIDEEPQGRVVDKEAFRLWCIANGYERQLQLWPSTMNNIAKERLLAGEAEPDGVEVNSYKKVVLTKARKKKSDDVVDVSGFEVVE